MKKEDYLKVLIDHCDSLTEEDRFNFLYAGSVFYFLSGYAPNLSMLYAVDLVDEIKSFYN